MSNYRHNDWVDTMPTTPHRLDEASVKRYRQHGIECADDANDGPPVPPGPRGGPWPRLTSAGRFWLVYLALLALCTALGLKWAGVL